MSTDRRTSAAELEFLESIKNYSSAEIDRDISEISIDVEFITEQFVAESDRYNVDQTKEIELRLSLMKRKRELLKSELERRKN